MIQKFLLSIATLVLLFGAFGATTLAQPVDDNLINSVPIADAYVFVRDDCSHCNDLKEFWQVNSIITEDFLVHQIDIKTPTGAQLFDQATTLLKTGKVTPITLLRDQVYIGFSPDVAGEAFIDASANPVNNPSSFSAYLQTGINTATAGETCAEDPEADCVVDSSTLDVPVLGTINPQTVSLSVMAISLGFVDGFNPCAMWVLLTFLLILSQVGDRKKMIQVAGLFMLAEAVMYYFILNVWYHTWDFIKLDGIVTPLVGALALGSGGFFLYKYFKNKNKALTCDVTSAEHQFKTEQKIKKLINKPMSVMVALAIIGLALSVNVIEFACSVGIPQAFTKVLELNNLSFAQNQAYTLLYTLFYMADDLIVFGLAIWGYQKFYQVGQKYSKISTLVAGFLMLILGVLLIAFPDVLSF